MNIQSKFTNKNNHKIVDCYKYMCCSISFVYEDRELRYKQKQCINFFPLTFRTVNQKENRFFFFFEKQRLRDHRTKRE